MNKSFKKIFWSLNICLALVLSRQNLVAQDKSNTDGLLQFSGIVVIKDSVVPVPGVSIFNPLTGRGSLTNFNGVFTMPVAPGDSLLVMSMGYKKSAFIIPKDSTRNFKVLIEIEMDTLKLDEVVINRLPTEQRFKQLIRDIDPDNPIYYSTSLDPQKLALAVQLQGVINSDDMLNRMKRDGSSDAAIPVVPVLDLFKAINRISDKKDREKMERMRIIDQSY